MKTLISAAVIAVLAFGAATDAAFAQFAVNGLPTTR